jgi:thiamine biosynthesis protein ThiI
VRQSVKSEVAALFCVSFKKLVEPTEFDTIVVRLSGEIGIKSEWTRRTYEKQLLQNLKQTLKTQDLKPTAIESRRGRIYVKTQKPTETAKALTRVFGISSVSPAKQTTADLKTLTEATLVLADATIKDRTTFAVRCHRVGTHPYSSMELCRMLGEQILETYETRSPKVNLTNPEVIITVEVRDLEAYVYAQTLQGAGGFPLGTQARTICLLSGGIDSPVACWLTMKRGCPTVPVYIDNSPYTDERAKQKAIETARKLKGWSAGYIRKMYIVPNGENMKTIQEKTPPRFTCLLCKRLMYRIAECIADTEKAHGIVTGEAIGEQASQTMHNLFAIDEAATHYPIHRPLLGFDKLETEVIARKIGTFEISIMKAQGCTAAPSMPATQARLTAVKEAEEKLDIPAMVEAALKAAEIIEI